MRKRRNNGAVLVLFALLLFGILALASGVIEIGFVLLSRRTLQTAANSASLEGLRWSGRPADPEELEAALCRPPTPAELSDPVLSSRIMARHFINLHFDNDYSPCGEPATGDNLNAGLGASFGEGINDDSDIGGGLRAGPTVNVFAYRPTRPDPDAPPILNETNDYRGDFVSGVHNANLPPGAVVPNDPYNRPDFTPTLVNPQAFLARLRRSGEPLPAEIGTPGPPVPFLFGRGAIARAETPAAPDAILARRNRGTVVRATTIAAAVPALSVWLSSTAASLGTAFLANRSDWIAATPSAPASYAQVNPTGIVSFAGNWILVGDQAPDSLAIADWSGLAGNGVVILSDVLSDGSQLVVGFGFATIVVDPADPTQGALLPRPDTIAPRNAVGYLARSPQSSSIEISGIIRDLTVMETKLLAPAKVRTLR